jgi:hypothetical protein
MEFALLPVVLVLAGLWLLIIGYAKSAGLWKRCGNCSVPLVDGYAAYQRGKYYCLGCCEKLSIRPWYLKDWVEWPPTPLPPWPVDKANPKANVSYRKVYQ